MGAKDTETPVQVLERWEHHGATWRTVHLSETKAIVDLCTCFGEPVERLESDDPELLEYLRVRKSADPE